MKTVRLTAAQAMMRYLMNQFNEEGETFIAGMWAIFGHGNVAGIGEALHGVRGEFQTYRGQNEQSMAHAAIAYTKQLRRKRAMAVTSSIGPGAANMITAAALAHVNRLPVLLVPGDVFADRGPDPVLQQLEDFNDGVMTVNDCFRPVSRYFDRIMRPEHLLTALPRALRVMTDPADCGPVTLAFCQDVQAEAYDYPESFFARKIWYRRQPRPDERELAAAVEALKAARHPVIVAGGGVHFAGACDTLKAFVEKHDIPVVETQAGKSALAWDHKANFGPVGVTGAASANAVCENADLVIGVGTRFQDFTTGSWSLFRNPERRILALNVQAYDSAKHEAIPLVCDAKVGLELMSAALDDFRFAAADASLKAGWFEKADAVTAPPGDGNSLPTDMQVIGAVQRASRDNTVVMCAAGTMPGELHQLWKAKLPLSYHMEYGFSCMGYEVAGGLGIKMAEPHRDVIVMVGDGSYMMMNSELATAVAMGLKITVVITDNRGYGCINRLQMETGGAEFNNLYAHTNLDGPPPIDFAAHAASMGASTTKVSSIAELEKALEAAREATVTTVVVIDTDPYPVPDAGGYWWDVVVPEVSARSQVNEARTRYEAARKERR